LSGLSASTSAEPSFTAPLVGRDNATLIFELTVDDGLMAATDVVMVTVENVNHAPVAHAGEPQAYNEGSVVRLNGAASSDPDGHPLGYRWTRISGPTVALVDASTPTPTFVAPRQCRGGDRRVRSGRR
jgi:PKD domain